MSWMYRLLLEPGIRCQGVGHGRLVLSRYPRGHKMCVEVTRGYLRTQWGQIHYQAAGRTGPVVVLFHESPLSSWIFERALPLLGRKLRAFAFDTPGYGQSEPPQYPLEIGAYAERLLAAVDSLGVDSFAVAGTHTGASIAVEVAAQAGESRITHAVLSGVPLLTPEERKSLLSSWAPDLPLDEHGRHFDWAWKRYEQSFGPDAPLELVNRAAISITANHDKYNWAYQAAFRYDPEPALRSLNCPVLFLTPDGDGLAEADRTAAEFMAQADLHIIPSMLGQLPWRAPDLYASELESFILK